jgi:phosphoribosylanthranilate isomerase
MSVRVKICGLANAADIAATAALAPDYMGFIFWQKSPRAIAPEQVAAWTKCMTTIKKVGVFVDASLAEINATVDMAGLDVVQLHGHETRDLVGSIGCETWKVVHIDQTSAGDAEALSADRVLIDSYTSKMPGGTGLTVDWVAARNFVQQCSKDVWLAGGLQPSNVCEAIRQVTPWGVDVSSGVELKPGVKNMQAVKEFIDNSRNAL